MPRHQTLHKEVKASIKLLRRHECVKQVVIGRYENCRHRYTPGSLKISRKTGNGFKLAGYDGSGIYDFYVYLKEPLQDLSQNSEASTEVEAYIKHLSK